MIAWLKGMLQAKSPDAVVVDVNGVGYLLALSLNSFCQLPAVGGKVSIEVFTYVREDQISLFGFLLPGEKEAFRQLMAVSGIGPRLALNILSGINPDELAEAVAMGNLKRLQAVPGVGKKTAERILIELKDKLKPSGAAVGVDVTKLVVSTALTDDLVLALSTLGYKRAEIDPVVQRLPVDPGSSLEQLIKESLRMLRPKGA